MLRGVLVAVWVVTLLAFVVIVAIARPQSHEETVMKPVHESRTKTLRVRVPYVDKNNELAFQDYTKDVPYTVTRMVPETRTIVPTQRETLRYCAFGVAAFFYIGYSVAVFCLWLRDRWERRQTDLDSKEIETRLSNALAFAIGIIAATLGMQFTNSANFGVGTSGEFPTADSLHGGIDEAPSPSDPPTYEPDPIEPPLPEAEPAPFGEPPAPPNESEPSAHSPTRPPNGPGLLHS